MQPYEKLGAFYLGKIFNAHSQSVADDLLLYDSKDLTTHAVCVGMTGSGKTGLCLSLLEEAAIDGIPTIAIDPKGDLGNLLLTFPNLQASDFRPWIDEPRAAQKGLSPEEYAARTAEQWKTGLASWGQSPERIARFRNSVDLAIYTPGSRAGWQLALLRSFAAPPEAVVGDAETFQAKIAAGVSGLLALLGIEADPIQSREHILLSNIFQHSWSQGRDLDLPMLIHQIQSPPFERVGIMDVESFFPAKDRNALAMRLNNLLASPGFSVWMEGQPLEIKRLLWTPEGKPRLSILSIAHLSDPQRMFFVTLLLNEILAWARMQSGTSSLRAVVYMDEVFGYFPPTANPPSKTPMLTLLKQARAYGLGIVLATQNPVDLDYKGLSNTGTWFLGRLQTERDLARVIDGLEGASATAGQRFDRQHTEALLSGLKSRVFLVNNVHEDEPVLMHTRWALSYLKGPLTRTQIQTLMQDKPQPQAVKAGTRPQAAHAQAATAVPAAASLRPALPPEIEQLYLPISRTIAKGEHLLYRPALWAVTNLHYVRAKYNLDRWEEISAYAPLDQDTADEVWERAEFSGKAELDGQPEPADAARFAALPAPASKARSYQRWSKELTDYLYRHREMKLWTSSKPKAFSHAGEEEGDFRVRLRDLVHEKRDQTLEKLRKRYAPKLARLQERIRKAEARVEREQDQVKQHRLQTRVSFGATLVGALFGRKISSVGRRAASTARSAGRVSREKGDVRRARESLKALQQRLQELENEFQEEADKLEEPIDPAELELEPVLIRPRKSDIDISCMILLWTPWRVDHNGVAEKAFAQT